MGSARPKPAAVEDPMTTMKEARRAPVPVSAPASRDEGALASSRGVMESSVASAGSLLPASMQVGSTQHPQGSVHISPQAGGGAHPTRLQSIAPLPPAPAASLPVPE